MTDRWSELDHIVALTLLKLRMLTNLKTIDNSPAVADKVPQVLLDSIQDNLIIPVVAGKEEVVKDIKDGKSLRPHFDRIESHIDELFERVDKANRHFWPALIEPGHHLSARSDSYSFGTVEEMQLALKHNYRLWIETPGAIECKLQD